MADKMMVVQGVANRLYATEAAIDAALAESAQLVQSVLSAREELNLSAGVVDAAVAKAAQSIATLAAARQQVVAAHEELAEVKLRIGIRTRMIGERPKHQSGPSVAASLAAVA